MNPIHIEPLQFNWRTEWLPRVRLKIWKGCTTTSEIVAAVTKWQLETDDWLRGLGTQKQADVIKLLEAENDLLWWYVTDAVKGYVPWARLDFRQRWFDAIPLARAADRIRLDGASRVLEMYRELEVSAEQIGWLP